MDLPDRNPVVPCRCNYVHDLPSMALIGCLLVLSRCIEKDLLMCLSRGCQWRRRYVVDRCFDAIFLVIR